MSTSFADRLIARAQQREPDFIIGGRERPYVLRWWLSRRAKWLPGAYVHQFLRSDDDRALHDHPFSNISILLRGEYTEHTIAQGGIHQRRRYQAGDVIVRLSGRRAHRIELHTGPCWTLFLRGPVYRQWGFHCPERGWVHWKDFTAHDDIGAIGKGCEGCEG